MLQDHQVLVFRAPTFWKSLQTFWRPQVEHTVFCYILLGDSHHLYMDQLLTRTIISGVYGSCPELIIWEAVAIWANNSCSLQPCYEASCRYEEMVGRKMTHLHLVSCYDTIIRVRVLGPRNGRNEAGPRGVQQDSGHLLGLNGSCSPDKNQVYPIGFLNKRRGGG